MPKVAVLIDGGFALKRMRSVLPAVDPVDPVAVRDALMSIAARHLIRLRDLHGGGRPESLLYRTFYYDARPYDRRVHTPIGKVFVKFGETPQARFRNELFDLLRRTPNVAVRLGETSADQDWALRPSALTALLAGKRSWSDLTDDDFAPAIRQRAADMRLGLDIASITLKRQADILVLVTGDSDFVPAAKLARREGAKVILDSLWQSVRPDLFEHIDELQGSWPQPLTGATP